MPTSMDVNVDNFRKLINFLKAEGDAQTDLIFDMDYWSVAPRETAEHTNRCGSVMCIGGACEYLAGHPPGFASGGEMGKWLGLPERAAHSLFFPEVDQIHNYDSSREYIIDMLEGVLTGDVIFDDTKWVYV